MKNGMLTIFRKELARFFGDKRTALGTILLPGILIFAVYTFMGSACPTSSPWMRTSYPPSRP